MMKMYVLYIEEKIQIKPYIDQYILERGVLLFDANYNHAVDSFDKIVYSVLSQRLDFQNKKKLNEDNVLLKYQF